MYFSPDQVHPQLPKEFRTGKYRERIRVPRLIEVRGASLQVDWPGIAHSVAIVLKDVITPQMGRGLLVRERLTLQNPARVVNDISPMDLLEWL